MTGLVLPAELRTDAQVLFESHWSFNRGYRARTFDTAFFETGDRRMAPVWDIGAGVNMAFRRDVFDEARNALAQDMAYSQNLAKIGYVKGVGAAPISAPRGNLTTDPYYTAGMRSVLVFEHRPTSLDQVAFFPWESPPVRTSGRADR